MILPKLYSQVKKGKLIRKSTRKAREREKKVKGKKAVLEEEGEGLGQGNCPGNGRLV